MVMTGDLPWPLRGVDPADPYQGGFRFLEETQDGQTLHCGIDLNTPGGPQTDLGAPIACPAPGVIRFRGWWDGVARGEGNHIWIEHDTGEWSHYDHLLSTPVPEDTRISRGAVFALCGRSGGWPAAHLHFEVLRQRPTSWWMWPKHWPRQDVEVVYLNPVTWLQALASAEEQDGGSDDVGLSDEERKTLTERITALEADQVIQNRRKLAFEAYLRGTVLYTKRGRRYRLVPSTIADDLIAQADAVALPET